MVVHSRGEGRAWKDKPDDHARVRVRRVSGLSEQYIMKPSGNQAHGYIFHDMNEELLIWNTDPKI